MNPMKEIRIEKITINIGAGEAGPKLEKAKNLLSMITNKKIVVTKTHKRTTFGVAKGRQIGVKTIIRGKEAVELLKKMLKAVENKLSSKQFDNTGNFSFGIKEYIDIPGVKYNPDIGMIGMDVCVTLERPGFRVKRRKIKKGKIGKSHNIRPQESIEWIKRNFNVEIIND